MIGEEEPRRHDSHYVKLGIVDPDGLAEQTGIAAKSALPQAMAQNDNVMRTCSVVSG
jgi:hypothetical protein